MPDDEIKPYQEWARNPSWHGSYDDYVKHMRVMNAYFRKLDEDRLVARITDSVAKRLGKIGLK